jgi:uncharacterized lipoprotein YmbA
MDNAVWAEPLDQGFQRSLAANLAHLLPTDQLRLSDWRPGEISLSLHVIVQQFDVDTLGHAELVAWWRIVAPTAGQTLRSGETRLSLEGSPPLADPQAMAATMSALVGELSKVLATAIKETQLPGS